MGCRMARELEEIQMGLEGMPKIGRPMSARFPNITEPEAVAPRVITFHGQPESTLSICWERGYPTKLVAPDLQSETIKIEITATRRQIQEAQREDTRRVQQYHLIDYATPRQPSKEWDRSYQRGQPWTWKVRCYFEPDVIADVLREQRLDGRIIHLRDYHAYKMVYVTAERPTFRAAQYEWLRRLMITPPKPMPCKIPDLF